MAGWTDYYTIAPNVLADKLSGQALGTLELDRSCVHADKLADLLSRHRASLRRLSPDEVEITLGHWTQVPNVLPTLRYLSSLVLSRLKCSTGGRYGRVVLPQELHQQLTEELRYEKPEAVLFQQQLQRGVDVIRQQHRLNYDHDPF